MGQSDRMLVTARGSANTLPKLIRNHKVNLQSHDFLYRACMWKAPGGVGAWSDSLGRGDPEGW